jgi:hypothetical protein
MDGVSADVAWSNDASVYSAKPQPLAVAKNMTLT